MLKQGFKTFKFVKNFKKYKNATSEAERIKAAKLISGFIQKEGGLFLKAAQYMGTNPKHHEELEKLSFMKDSGLSIHKIKKILNKEIKNFRHKYLELEDTAFCASVGQVHKAKNLAGDPVAIKVQYPHIRKELTNQLKMLNLIPTSKVEKKWGIDINQYKLMIQRLIDNELDYTKELKIQEKVHKALGVSIHYKIPRPYIEDSNERVLITDFLDGKSSNELTSYSQKDLYHLSESLVYTYLSLLKNNYTQGDSNHGNFIFLKTQVGLIDFGQFYEFDKKFVDSFISLLYKLIEGKDLDYFSYYCSLGFSKEKLEFVSKDLGVLSLIIFKPFLENKKTNLDLWSYKEDIDEVLGDNKWWFRSAGGEEFFIILKSFLGFKNLIQKHKAHVNWQQIFKEVFVENKEHYLSLKPLKVTSDNKQIIGKKLVVTIKKQDQEIVQTLPLVTLLDLEEYLSSEVKESLEKRGININNICKQALRDGAKCGVLFSLKEDHEFTVEII